MQAHGEAIETPTMLKQTQDQQTESESIPESEPKSTESKTSPIYLGAKKFESVDELARYTSELEYQKNHATYQPAVQTQEKPISELLFENPEKALELHEQRVLQRIQNEQLKKQQEQDLWSKFYSNNKDLSEDREVVDFVLGKNWESLRSLHPDQAMEKLAEQTRSTLAKFRKTSEKSQELPSGQAKVGPTGTRSAPTISEKQAAPVDFVTQLKKIQSKRK